MTQIIFPTIVYRQIISLFHNSSGLEVYIHYSKLTVPWKIPENDVMALEASDRLIDII